MVFRWFCSILLSEIVENRGVKIRMICGQFWNLEKCYFFNVDILPVSKSANFILRQIQKHLIEVPTFAVLSASADVAFKVIIIDRKYTDVITVSFYLIQSHDLGEMHEHALGLDESFLWGLVGVQNTECCNQRKNRYDDGPNIFHGFHLFCFGSTRLI